MPEIGDQLRETRMRSRIDITEVEAATKIRAKYLRALENEEWDLLPGPTFVKTFLRTYADYLGLDARMLVEEYRQRYERPASRSSRRCGPTCPGGADAGAASRIAPWLPLAAGFVLLVGRALPARHLGRRRGAGAERAPPRPPRPPRRRPTSRAGGAARRPRACSCGSWPAGR